MSWIEKLYHTYENNLGSIANPNDAVPLLPLFHSTQNAQIHVVLNGQGKLLDASVVMKDDAQTIIPATEASAGRAGAKIAPHALNDTLQYVAGDYLEYGGNPNKDNNEPGFEPYIKALQGWVESSKNRKLQAVFTYLKKGQLIKDLVEKKVLVTGKDKNLVGKWTASTEPPLIFKAIKQAKKKGQFEALVRFSVEIPGDNPSELWKDNGLRKSWGQYYTTLQNSPGLCMVTGEMTSLATNHPKNIRYPGDSAKLISSNDKKWFTYLGRFTADSQACGISVEVTQKAHSALRWLIERQGRRDSEQVVVAWAVSGADVPDPQWDTLTLLLGGEQMSPATKTGYTAQEAGVALSRKMAGYTAKLKSTDAVVVLGLDSASVGRMAISFCRELTGSEFIERIEAWHTGCCWQQYFGKDRIFFGAPAPRDIAEAAFGTWRDGKLHIDDKLNKATIQRILPCIVDGAKIPRDLVISCVRRASNRNGIEYWVWEKALGIACALYKYVNKDRGYTMALEHDRKSRDYLYGRLLALAERLENQALTVGGEQRETNAARFMQRFAMRPYVTWLTIETSLSPYKGRLMARHPGFLWLLEKELDTVMCLFKPEDFLSDQPLSGEFLLGYHCQRCAPLKKNAQEEIVAENVEAND